MSIGSFTIIKNEKLWIGAHLQAWLPFLDQMVFFDGNSTDGTLETIKAYKERHPFGGKIRLVENKDPKDLFDDYIRVNNECLHALKTDIAWFLHPDMFPISGQDKVPGLGNRREVAYSVGMVSYGGNPGEDHVFEAKGRAKAWKTVMRLKNPDLGLHYFGAYGASNEDMYFRAITGDSHDFYDTSFDAYPYSVHDSGVVVAHFADVRPLIRRIEKMRNILITLGNSKEQAEINAAKHPRVCFKDGYGISWEKKEWPEAYTKALDKHNKFTERSMVNA